MRPPNSIRSVPRDKDAKIIEHGRLLRKNGASDEELIVSFRDAGLNWIWSVRALHLATGMSLGEAKSAVHFSETWADQRQHREAFWAESEAAIADVGAAHSEEAATIAAAHEPDGPQEPRS